jgi:uncharacterized membrane protein YkvA (DUF1232 family)
MGILTFLFCLAVAIPVLRAVLPAITEAVNTAVARNQRERMRQEISHLPPAEQLHLERQIIDARPLRAEPIDAVKKGGFMGKFVVVSLCVAYIFFPIDFIPDFIPVLGWGDDVAAGIIGLRALMK